MLHEHAPSLARSTRHAYAPTASWPHVGTQVHYHGKQGMVTQTTGTRSLVEWQYPSFGLMWVDDTNLLTETMQAASQGAYLEADRRD